LGRQCGGSGYLSGVWIHECGGRVRHSGESQSFGHGVIVQLDAILIQRRWIWLLLLLLMETVRMIRNGQSR
jgi:hypothetical protein